MPPTGRLRILIQIAKVGISIRKLNRRDNNARLNAKNGVVVLKILSFSLNTSPFPLTRFCE